MSKEAMKLAREALIAATPVKANDPYMQAAALVALEKALAKMAEQPAQQEPGLLGGDQCDRLFTLVMSKLASKHNPSMLPEDLNPNIVTHHALRHSIIQAAFMAGVVSATPQAPKENT